MAGVTGHRASSSRSLHPVPEILTLPELALYVRVSKSSLYQYARAGKIPGRKIGRHWRFHKSAIDNWVKNDKPATLRGEKRPRRTGKRR